jgi:hypothetical protein
MRAAALLLLLLPLAPLPGQRALPSRGEIAAVEESLYNKLRAYDINAPIEVLGLPRGLYLEGYGAVFTAEINLLQTAGLSPFRPKVTPEEAARVRAAKRKRLPEVRAMMRRMLIDSAASLDRVPMSEQVVLGLVFAHHSWEDRGGLPQLITMQAQRQTLVDAATRRTPPETLTAALRIREE